jgi:multicomponent Na+:H+ antiporter subunit E
MSETLLTRLTAGRRWGSLGVLAALVGTWLLLWGSISVANVLSGIVVSVALLLVFPVRRDDDPHRHLRPLPLVRLAGFFVLETVLANVVAARHVLGQEEVRTAIIACPLRVRSDGMVTFLVNLLAVSPGTMPIELDQDPPVVYLHVLYLEDAASIRAVVAKFETLAVQAFGSDEDRALLAEPPEAEVSEADGDELDDGEPGREGPGGPGEVRS